MVNVLLRADPSRTRTLSERAQADEIYHPGQSLRVRNQFLASPITDFTDERVDSSTERALTRTDSASQYGLCTTLPPLHPRESPWVEVNASHSLLWRCSADIRSSCPTPIPDPETNQDQAWLLEDGVPPGHGFCGHW